MYNFSSYRLNLIATQEAELGKNNNLKIKKIPGLYADEAAWLSVITTENILDEIEYPISSIKDNVGIITVSEFCTINTINYIALESKKGRISPLKFAGANPGSLCSLPCIMYGFKGPTLTLTMSPCQGIDLAFLLSKSWFDQGLAVMMFINVYEKNHLDKMVMRTMLIEPKI